MERENSQKIKLLKLWELLREQTDPQHPMTTQTVCARLEELGISCERRTLSRDIRLLNEWGYTVSSKYVGKQLGYFVPCSGLTEAELRILADAVQAANFIPPKLTQQLIEKLACSGNCYRAELLHSTTVQFNNKKHSNEDVFRTVELIEAAILQKKKVGFFYFDLDEHRRRVYRKDRLLYTVSPISMVYAEDFYYLLAFSDEHEAIRHYRIDRMEAMRLLDEPVPKTARLPRASTREYTKQLFRMFAGPMEAITLRFDDALIGAVYDKLGEKTRILRTAPHTCETTVLLQHGPTLDAWVAQFGGRMQIVKKPKATAKNK